MNAYELADDLAFKHIAGDDSGACMVKLQDMLRQQADRIAELEADVEKKVVMIGLWEAKFKELAEATGFAGYLAGMMVFEDKTPQIKELSDEEIDRVVDETYGVPRNPAIYAMHRRLARAILRKAQEK